MTSKDPEVVTYGIPKIEVYHVSDDELGRIEAGCKAVGQDLTLCLAAGSVCLSFVVALFSAPLDQAQGVWTFYLVMVMGSGVLAVSTGINWFRKKTDMPNTISKIRSRKVEPQPPTTDPPPSASVT